MKKSNTHTLKQTQPIYILALVIVLTLAFPLSALANSPTQPMTLVVLGDSIAWGASAPAGQGYASLVANDQNMVLINRAVGGWRTEHVINQLKTDPVTQEAVKAAGVIQIAIGGNDLQQAGYVGPAIDALVRGDASVWDQHCENIAGRFAQIVELVRELNPKAPFFVFNSYTPDYKRFGDNEISVGGTEALTGNSLYTLAQNYAIPRFNSTYIEYLRHHPGAFILVDIFDAFPGNASFYFGSGSDTIHPSAAGHEKLAERLNAAIDSYNEKNMKVTAAAKIDKMNGNMNLLTITVTESFPLKPTKTVEVSALINNNSAGYYSVGKYTVYVDTKGNTQIRACYIVPFATSINGV